VFTSAMSTASPIVCIGTAVRALTFVAPSAPWYSVWRTMLVISSGPDFTREAMSSITPIIAGRAAT
jgi:hypothetical protein